METKLQELERILRLHEPLLIAYSGGIDSACLLAVAVRVLGPRVTGVIADSPSLPRRSLEDALENARRFGTEVEVVRTAEMDDPRYVQNALDRCYFCKAELFRNMELLAGERGFAALAYGENADDPAHSRPGSRAAAEFHVIAPLKQAGLTKAEVRSLARRLGLPNADAPAQPCLSSRIPHGIPVTRDALAHVERGEAALRNLGFRVFRVRYMEGVPPSARVQVAAEETVLMRRSEDAIRRVLNEAGFATVELDSDSLRPAASA